MRLVAALILVAGLAVATGLPVMAQRNGEATSSVPAVERERYDVATFMRPLTLSEAELNGRRIVAQRCANCHGGNARQPGPPLGRQIVESRGEAFVRDKVRKGSPPLMPGFEYTLQPAQVDEIVAFLKTYSPPARSEAGSQE